MSLDLTSCKPYFDMSWPSMRMEPSAASMIRNRAKVREDLPAPVRPTIPTWEEGTEQLTQCTKMSSPTDAADILSV